jgi:23S rRNA (cytidine1920-2'-O)/16S rRNA (cytidine1409-2'-O)-methyltransferase
VEKMISAALISWPACGADAVRLDSYLVQQGLARTRSKAVHLIRTGKVTVNGEVAAKQSREVGDRDRVELLSWFTYVGRGGYKLEGFARGVGLECAGKRVLDVGCSTGGFTDFFLQAGAASVVAVDVAGDIIDKWLLADPRLTFVSGLDARDADALRFRLGDVTFDIISVDITNVPLGDVLPGLARLLAPGGLIVALFKPPYEGGMGRVDEAGAEALATRFEASLAGSFEVVARGLSQLRGGTKGTGTREMFYLLRPL